MWELAGPTRDQVERVAIRDRAGLGKGPWAVGQSAHPQLRCWGPIRGEAGQGPYQAASGWLAATVYVIATSCLGHSGCSTVTVSGHLHIYILWDWCTKFMH